MNWEQSERYDRFPGCEVEYRSWPRRDSLRTVPPKGGITTVTVQSTDTITDHDKLIEKWIEPDPVKGGRAEFRLKEYGVHMWALAGYLRAVDGDIAEVARAFDVPVEAAQAAAAYYKRHKVVIDDRIAANSS